MNLEPIRLPEGVFLAHFSARGLARLDWPVARRLPPRRASAHGSGAAQAAASLARWKRQTVAALRLAVSGRASKVLPPLDLAAGTAFQQAVWGLLQAIPPGQTRTYGWLASQLGRPGAARAVGNACGANPVPLLIPCHRVVPAGGGLGGFSGPPAWKKRLLSAEASRAPLRK